MSTMEDELRTLWLELCDRLSAKHLLQAHGATLSLRLPGVDAMWFGEVGTPTPRRVDFDATGAAAWHADIYVQRGDVGAIAIGGGAFGHRLAQFGGRMPEVFDEQARHLGRMEPALMHREELFDALAAGGNVVLAEGEPVCMGMTGTRMALNAELFEKCAKAYVLAVAAGGSVKPLPWLVRFIANRRLMKDEQNAKASWARGCLPQESGGY